MNFFNPIALVLLITTLIGCAQAHLQYSLQEAINNDNINLTKELLDKGAEVNDEFGAGRTPLINAIDKGDADIVRLLIERGGKVDFESYGGWIPLLKAIDKGDVDIVRLLIDRGANVNLKNKFGVTPLMRIGKSNNIEITKMLLKAGANVNYTDGDDGNTPLIEVATNGHPEIIQLLIDKGADINHKNTNGYTAFMLACLYGNSITATYIYEKKADIGIPDNNVEINGKANHILGDYFFAKDDVVNARKHFQKAQDFYKKTIDAVNADLGIIYLKQFGVFLLKTALFVAQSYNAQLQSHQLSQIQALTWANQNHTGIAGYNTYLNNYNVNYIPTTSQANLLFLTPSSDSLDEKEFITKKRVEQFEKLSALMTGILLCFDKGLTGHDLHVCVEEKAGIKR